MSAPPDPAAAPFVVDPPIRQDWLDRWHEEILEPELPIVDPHHHLWEQPYPRGRYLFDELLADLNSGDRRIFHRSVTSEDDGWVLAVFSVPESQRAQRHRLRTRRRRPQPEPRRRVRHR